jgi:hypothetical protein
VHKILFWISLLYGKLLKCLKKGSLCSSYFFITVGTIGLWIFV